MYGCYFSSRQLFLFSFGVDYFASLNKLVCVVVRKKDGEVMEDCFWTQMTDNFFLASMIVFVCW